MVYPPNDTYAMIQEAEQYILWYLPSPILANINFSHAHPPPEIPPLCPKHFLPCNMNAVTFSTPFEVDRSVTLTLEGIIVCSSMSY